MERWGGRMDLCGAGERAGRLLSFWRSGRFGVLTVLAGSPIWLPIWRRSGGGQSGAILTVLATAPFWRRSWYPAGTSWYPAGTSWCPAGAQLVPAGTQRSPDWASRQNGCATQFPASRIPARSARLSPDWARQIGAQLAPDWEVRQNGKVRQIDPARTAPER